MSVQQYLTMVFHLGSHKLKWLDLSCSHFTVTCLQLAVTCLQELEVLRVFRNSPVVPWAFTVFGGSFQLPWEFFQ
jgi:hypothetical protein